MKYIYLPKPRSFQAVKLSEVNPIYFHPTNLLHERYVMYAIDISPLAFVTAAELLYNRQRS